MTPSTWREETGYMNSTSYKMRKVRVETSKVRIRYTGGICRGSEVRVNQELAEELIRSGKAERA